MKDGYPKDISRVHLFRVKDKCLVYDVHSRVFLVLDEQAEAVLQASCKHHSKEKVVAALEEKCGRESAAKTVEELECLERKGVLFSPDASHGNEPPTTYPVVSSLCLNVAHDCNLRCPYCYAGSGKYRGSRQLMSVQVAKAAVDFLIRSSGARSDLSLAFFGGEPLLNFPVIKETVGYAEMNAQRLGKRFGYGVTTNGTMLDREKSDFLSRHRFGIIVSLDGTREIHDRHRVFKDGSGSYDQVIGNLQRIMADHPGKRAFSIRGTFTRKTLKLPEMVMHLRGLGFMDISIEPAHTKVSGFQWQDTDIEAVKEQYTNLAVQYIEKIKNGDLFSFFHFQRMMENTDRQVRCTAQCGAGTGYMSVAADGTLYPCHKLVGIERYRLGNVFTGVERTDIQELFEGAHVDSKKRCTSCWARYVCGGGCHAHNIEFSGDILEPYTVECHLMRHRIELGAYIYATLSAGERRALGLMSKQTTSDEWCARLKAGHP